MGQSQLHKRLSLEQVKTILDSYIRKEIGLESAMENLGLKRTRFFKVLGEYKYNPDYFSLDYARSTPNNSISLKAEEEILKELKTEKKLIEDKRNPVRFYNYSYIRDNLLDKDIKVSVPTIINRAKQHGYYLEKPERKIHDREVLTNMPGELVQHDSSHHLWSPYMDKKLYLITSIDDHSRLLLFADLFERETTWNHIQALKSVILQYGVPLKYYADQHSIFRYVKDRDKHSPWYTYTKFTDDVDPQWRQILKECKVEPVYALSPQAKGKVERPYRWIQERIVRTASREKLTTIDELKDVLNDLVLNYNTKWKHSTTGEVPIQRFEKALSVEQTLFKPLKLVDDRHINDIFCLKAERMVDAYRKVSLAGIELKVPNGLPKHKVQIKMVPDMKASITEVRFWQDKLFLGSYKMKSEDLKIVRF